MRSEGCAFIPELEEPLSFLGLLQGLKGWGKGGCVSVWNQWGFFSGVFQWGCGWGEHRLCFPWLWQSREVAGVIHVCELPAQIPCSASSLLSRHFCRAGLSVSQVLELEGLQ